mmetsp:Transcript_44101/g.94548  ORF Transcript_44101/g.94548 Transcript_44101/m.94548 type:complete len:311 (-) Transcript_44101:3215-4147(-)
MVIPCVTSAPCHRHRQHRHHRCRRRRCLCCRRYRQRCQCQCVTTTPGGQVPPGKLQPHRWTAKSPFFRGGAELLLLLQLLLLLLLLMLLLLQGWSRKCRSGCGTWRARGRSSGGGGCSRGRVGEWSAILLGRGAEVASQARRSGCVLVCQIVKATVPLPLSPIHSADEAGTSELGAGRRLRRRGGGAWTAELRLRFVELPSLKQRHELLGGGGAAGARVDNHHGDGVGVALVAQLRELQCETVHGEGGDRIAVVVVLRTQAELMEHLADVDEPLLRPFPKLIHLGQIGTLGRLGLQLQGEPSQVVEVPPR